jgi:hypothetical protein
MSSKAINGTKDIQRIKLKKKRLELENKSKCIKVW